MLAWRSCTSAQTFCFASATYSKHVHLDLHLAAGIEQKPVILMAGSVHKSAGSRVPQYSICALLEHSSSSGYCAQTKAVYSGPQDRKCHLGRPHTALQRPSRRRGSGVCGGICGEEGPLYPSFSASFWGPGDPQVMSLMCNPASCQLPVTPF